MATQKCNFASNYYFECQQHVKLSRKSWENGLAFVAEQQNSVGVLATKLFLKVAIPIGWIFKSSIEHVIIFWFPEKPLLIYKNVPNHRVAIVVRQSQLIFLSSQWVRSGFEELNLTALPLS